MIDFLKKDHWSPYVVGGFLGCLSLLSFYFMHHMLGTSTTFVRLAAVFWYFIDIRHLHENAYYMSYLEKEGWINWQAALVFGIFIGSFLANRLGEPKRKDFVPPVWKERFGNNKSQRALGAFIGGIIVLFGSRLAGGCTSGHIISGGMQLAVTGWLFMLGLFSIGVPFAYLFYKPQK